MKKLNNKGITLIELLLALAILSIFMITVNFFVTSATKSTKQTKGQVKVEQDAKEVYDTLYDAVQQATALEIKTNGVLSGTAESTDEDASGDGTVKKTVGFESALSSGGDVFLISPSAYNTVAYIVNQSVGQDQFDVYANSTVRKAATYSRKLGKMVQETNYLSEPQIQAGYLYYNGELTQYSSFDGRQYKVSGIYLGPNKLADGTIVYNTIVYEEDATKGNGKIYLNRNNTGADFSINADNLIADNCKKFGITVNTGKKNSINLEMKFSDQGFTYTTGGKINFRNRGIVQ